MLAFNNAKSSSAVVRTYSIELFKAIVQRCFDQTTLENATKELLRLPQSGKTTGPDHRMSLYGMLSSLPPSPAVSEVMAQAVPSLIVKENHDAAVAILAAALPAHIIFYCIPGNPSERPV
jgi:Generalcontrol nonderepressible 1 (Gcn1) N-terminal